MKIVKESLKIFESPDEISMPHLTYNKYGEPLENDIFKSPHFSDEDAHAFWYDDGVFHIGPAGKLILKEPEIHYQEDYGPIKN